MLHFHGGRSLDGDLGFECKAKEVTDGALAYATYLIDMASTSKIPDDEDIDYTDIEAKYQVPYDEGFDNVVVVDNVPIVDAGKKDKLLSALAKKFAQRGAVVNPEGLHLPWDEATGKSKGYMFIEFPNAAEAANAVSLINGFPFDSKHTLLVNPFTDIEKYARYSEKWVEPELPTYVPKEHLRWWLADGKDQFLVYRQDDVAIHWHMKTSSDIQTERKNWTDLFSAWSPQGTYLASLHRPGIRLWGGESWAGVARFAHPLVKLLDFSPCEKYLVTWSSEPVTRSSGPPGPASFTEDDEGNHIAVWDVKTGHLLRTFPMIQETEEGGAPKKMTWPAMKWSPDDRFVARITPGQQISVYELPGMGLLDKKSVKVEGVVEFDWCPLIDAEDDQPATGAGKEKEKKAAKRPRENFMVYWTPEILNQPARVTLMAFPSRTVLRTKNLFNVADAKLHWQNQGVYLCVKVDHYTKSKKSTYCNLEIFRVREKDFPVEVVEVKDTVTDFAWEPRGDRFAIVTSSDPNLGNAGPGITIKTEVHFYQLDRGVAPGHFRLLKKLVNKTSNTLRWSPKGRHILLATVGSSSKFDLEFWDLDFFADTPQAATAEWGAGVQLLGTGEHYGVTDIEWDPSGRYVATSASSWRHTMENGYTIWDFKGTELQKHILDRFKQFLWRPRPKTLLSKEQQKAIQRKLKEYSRAFDEEDAAEESIGKKELVAQRRRLVDEWNAWRTKIKGERKERRREEKEEATEVIEEWVEEVLDETVEVLE
ncbi:Translation initiation factor 3 subunit b [Tulasnella sp. 403]|nr:Translation initiation factor 3 subunit b [Tulasnella sp. 403]